jgi:hypothetical protein
MLCTILSPRRSIYSYTCLQEGLRLYPSTKRVYRAAGLKTTSTHQCANVEFCHRDPVIWGADTLEFRPHRFQYLSELQKQSYFPFGCKPHLCPAFGGFGERIVTMLVAAAGGERGLARWEICFNNRELQCDSRKSLPTGRGDMENWAFDVASAVDGKKQ